MANISDLLLEIENEQCSQLSNLKFGDKVAFIYNPLIYASETHQDYVRKYCTKPKSILFLGMNPGPFGMAQNGVPFGDTYYVNNWLKIKGNVLKPDKEHPRRIIQGLNCKRSEVSGKRFWSFLKDLSREPENFFKHCYVHNYCPFSMMSSSGKNITPPELNITEKKYLIDICDKALYSVLKLLQVKFIIGIGKFAKERSDKVVNLNNMTGTIVLGMMHPSPINPSANKGWQDIAYKQLEAYNIINYIKS